MKQYDGLIKALRTYEDGYGYYSQAADAIEKLQKENDFLKEMQRQLTKSVDTERLGMMVQNAIYRTRL